MKVACIGAGNIGRAWAVVFARAGHDVTLYDASAEEIRIRSLPLARETIGQLRDAGLIEEPVDTVFPHFSRRLDR